MSYTVTIEPIKVEVEVEEGQSLLDASLRAGVYLPHACCHGLCGTCKVTVLDGEVDHGMASSFALMDYERDEGLCLACCATPESDLVIEAPLDEDPDARVIPVLDYVATVTDLVDLTPTVKGVWVTLDGRTPFDYQPGQYVNLHVPGEADPRAFSIAGTDEACAVLEFNIRRVPGGKATGWIHDHLALGDEVRFSAPYGRFFIRRSRSEPVLLLAGGSGLSSPRAMAVDLLRRRWPGLITLVYGARDRTELYYHEDLEALAARHENFRYVPVLSEEPAGSGWDGRRGFVHEAASDLYSSDFRGNVAYICGPPPMIEASITALMRGRLFEKDIYTERFISAADATSVVRSPLFRRI